MDHRVDLTEIFAKWELRDLRLKGFEPVGGLGQVRRISVVPACRRVVLRGRQRPPQQPNRRPPAMGLRHAGRAPQERRLTTSLTPDASATEDNRASAPTASSESRRRKLAQTGSTKTEPSHGLCRSRARDRRSSTLRRDSGYFTYIITTRRITFGELLKYRNGLLMPILPQP
jgi:hypothetical protein